MTHNHQYHLPYPITWHYWPNDVAECTCGRLFVLRVVGWGEWRMKWVPLRWWHFKAKRRMKHGADHA